ncbi:HAD family hydrolase [Mangrovibacter yixingensis]|uniref:HAD family hydrolase n=1 Tax=Mangrovibacter yixingensis TaxID=1529639 RepID=UPI001CFAFE48|nr:HAD family hydrolase [Mangrovibacter yixingensis]
MKIRLLPLAVVLLPFMAWSAENEPLSAWNASPAKAQILSWVAQSTQQDGPDFIPVNQRYVVFDNDGTLWPEAPLTFQLQFAVDEVNRLAPSHPEWQDNPVVIAAQKHDMAALAKAGQQGLMTLLTLTHSNMPVEEFDRRVDAWLASHRHPRFGCPYNKLGYLPMRQLLDYLREKGFKTWIISGGGIDFMRRVAGEMYGIPPEQVVGSFSLTEFRLTDDGTQLEKTMKGAFYNDEAQKPVSIHLFMGHRPVAAFGNSDGDVPMLQYTSANKQVKPLGVLIHHTDAQREYAYDAHPSASGKLINGLSLAPHYGWVVVNMKSDWNQVFDPAQCSYHPAN